MSIDNSLQMKFARLSDLKKIVKLRGEGTREL